MHPQEPTRSQRAEQEHSASMSIQPVLTPCKGSLCDVTIQADPSDPDRLLLSWGLALILALPRDRNSLLFRVTAALLAGMGLSLSSLEECLGVTAKTLRSWLKDLREGKWQQHSALFHGPGAARMLSPEVERYVRVRYREAIRESGPGRAPYGFSAELRAELARYWGIEPSGETLRLIFREEDALVRGGISAAVEAPAGANAEADRCTDPESENAGDTAGRIGEEDCASGSALSADGDENPNVAADPAPDAPAEGPRDEGREPPDNGDRDTASDVTPGEPADSTVGSGSAMPEGPAGRGPCTIPLLNGSVPPGPVLSQHAGLFLLTPWFGKAFDSAPAILRQTAAQVLAGAVNQEQSKNIDFAGLGLLTASPIRDIGYQRRLLSDCLGETHLMQMYAANADLLGLNRFREFYVDPHHKEYTGMEKLLLAWSGSRHDTRKGVLMDFIHTPDGDPCFIGHFDNYYDARDRFPLLIDRFRQLFPEDATGFTWINDRGYWGADFLRRIEEDRDFYIQWQKGYAGDAWDPSGRSERLTIVRERNNSRDPVNVCVQWQEQVWSARDGGRRLIAKISRSDVEPIEVAIITNHPDMEPERVIRLMLNRWLQENDFSYLRRHFGIDQLSGRRFEPYRSIADELEDREVENRDYREARRERDAVKTRLGRQLVGLRNLPGGSSVQELDHDRDQLRREADSLKEQLDRVLAGPDTGISFIRRISKAADALSERLDGNRAARKQAEKRERMEREAEALEAQLRSVQERLRGLNRTESRLLALIEQRYVRPDMSRKALLDAVRITCRNVFRHALNTFRPIYDNYRDDHEVLRALTRSSGVIIRAPGSIDIHLTPALHRQPEQWKQIAALTGICSQRIRNRTGVKVRFPIAQSDDQIFDAIERARRSADAG
jgi:FtsZ-binding cell division protein ZapB